MDSVDAKKYQKFVFKDYAFDTAQKTARFTYGYDETLEFTETYSFDFDFQPYDDAALDRAVQLLFFVAGVSYYKAYLSPQIEVLKGQIDAQTAEFLQRTYQRGLGEFFYVNQLDPRTPVTFPITSEPLIPLPMMNDDAGTGLLVGLGGGKDSLLTVELLRDQPKLATWSLNHRSQLEPLVQTVGLPHFWVRRDWDHQLLEINQQDALNGHVPISAIFACVGTVVALLTGYHDTLVSNESSASEPTLVYQGIPINHQYSKSLDYEKDFEACLHHLLGDRVRYYSFLRPLTELRIAELFVQLGFQKYQAVFSSCNRAYTHDQDHMFWCGECPKCAFIFLAFTPFMERSQLEAIWGGKNLLLDPKLERTYRQLLGIAGDKPFDCVGEIKEARAAMRLAQAVYPELEKHQFELPDDYDFRAPSPDAMPPDASQLFINALERLK